ncbi:MAG: hypothetical protein JWN66_4980 [Sphingomonas bacterium]|uniref:GDSL-type esterase/lipase family protein n=1 Tax=Sphingomonas bacterium TaxID=1895847 RepID=UPI002614A686|nr:GDSL-type esterase/lipase family protein [Sphingomonas bacterium]MDB5707864.1 hypothetical protein [Sphingomonas bacterium]
MAVISEDVFSGPYDGDGVVAGFPFTFSILTATDIGVYVDGVRKINLTDYNVTFDAISGTVNFNIAPADGTVVLLKSEPDFLQTSEFANQGAYNLSTINTINRRQAIREIVLKDGVDRALKVPLGEEASALPSLADLDGKVLGVVGGAFVGVPNDAVDVAAAVISAETARDAAEDFSILTGEDAVQTALDVIAANAAVALLPHRYSKTQDATITSDATLNVDTDLSVPIAANALVRITGKIYFTTTAAADFKWRHTGPASPTKVRVQHATIAAGDTAYSNIAIDTAFSTADIAVTGAAGTGWVEIDAVIANGVNAGNFGISWSQNTSDASNTTVEAGSYLEATPLPTPLEIAFSATAIAKLGDFTASSFAGHTFASAEGGVNGNSHIEVMARGITLFAQLYAGSYTLQIDGGAPSTITAPAGWSFVPLFQNQPEALYRVKLTGPTIENVITFRLAGAAPLFSRPSDIPSYYRIGDAAYSGYIAAEGVKVIQTFFGAGNPNHYYWEQPSGAGLRFRATTTSVRIWTYNGLSPMVLLQDGVQVGGIITPPATTGYDIVTLATGLSGTHDYEIRPIWIGVPIFIYALLVDTLSATAQTPKAVDAYYGDSIVQGNVLISAGVTDARVMDAFILANATGRASIRVGASGAKVSTALKTGTAAITGLASVPTRVVSCGGVNDMIQAVPVATFQADYQTMLSSLRTGLPSAKIYARGILPVGTTVANYATRSTYNAAIAAAVTALADANIVYRNTDGWITPATDTIDGLHPNAAGYAKIAAAMQLVL